MMSKEILEMAAKKAMDDFIDIFDEAVDKVDIMGLTDEASITTFEDAVEIYKGGFRVALHNMQEVY